MQWSKQVDINGMMIMFCKNIGSIVKKKKKKLINQVGITIKNKTRGMAIHLLLFFRDG
jgi:hypothetical protein